LAGQAVLGFLRENALFLAFLVALGGGYLYLRQGASSVSSAAEYDSLVAQGKPSLVEFYADT
jgi:hypothetical protein